MDGFLLIDKEVSWTSRDVCNKIQSIFHTKKVGHIGTLDPFATGLLVVTVNRATKAGQFIDDKEKIYEAILTLGEKKDTADITGETTLAKEIIPFTKKEIEEVFASLIGELDQVPPLTSAVHYKGRRLYEYLHDGEIVTPPSRKIKVNKLELIDFNQKEIKFRCTVSKGTYVRTLGETIAERLNNVGYLSTLRRISIGSLKVEKAIKISEVNESKLISINDGLVDMKHITLNSDQVKKAKNGVILDLPMTDEKVLLIDENNNPIAVYGKTIDNKYRSLRGLWE